ncbi:hypothetical protein PENTCL1PPCAC_17039 [Pristionchus entomophagus]|uniref:Uncharacterized protein n=1 Tax=Pristionchus entomophagus TaxID=358040 RepID=A0AAV5TKM5_9BILA|nr:hypothetical protein PENTCL1PPCAC_17039 [Pristionchus entomophagus]
MSSASSEFPGTLLPVLAICIVPPMTFVLIFFLCTYCILVRQSPSSSHNGVPSPSMVRVQSVAPSVVLYRLQMHLGYVIMCVMFGLMIASFLLL